MLKAQFVLKRKRNRSGALTAIHKVAEFADGQWSHRSKAHKAQQYTCDKRDHAVHSTNCACKLF